MKVKFVPQNVEFEIKPGESVMHLAEDNGIYVKSVCRGVPSCAECRVRVVDGETNTFQPVAAELALIGSGWFIDRRRLSCQLQCIGDVTVDTSEQIAKQQGLIGGRKAKAAKALGDRVEDETVIRESTAGVGSRGAGRRDRDGDEGEDRDEDAGPGEAHDSQTQQGGRGNRSRDQRPEPPRNNIVIGGPKPVPSQPSGGGIQPRRDQSASGPSAPGAGSSGETNGGGGRGGRSRRGGRGRR